MEDHQKYQVDGRWESINIVLVKLKLCSSLQSGLKLLLFFHFPALVPFAVSRYGWSTIETGGKTGIIQVQPIHLPEKYHLFRKESLTLIESGCIEDLNATTQLNSQGKWFLQDEYRRYFHAFIVPQNLNTYGSENNNNGNILFDRIKQKASIRGCLLIMY